MPTSPAVPNVQREATEARIYLRRAIFHLQRAVSAGRCEGREEHIHHRLRAEQLFDNMMAWRKHNDNGGGESEGRSRASSAHSAHRAPPLTDKGERNGDQC